PVCLALAIAIGSGAAAAEQSVTGTFSSFAYNSAGGGLLGAEIRLLTTRHGMKAVVQVAEGGPGDVAPGRVVRVGNKIHFDLPAGSDSEGRFDGVVTRQALKGVFVYKSGAKETLNLPRKPSYWDR